MKALQWKGSHKERTLMEQQTFRRAQTQYMALYGGIDFLFCWFLLWTEFFLFFFETLLFGSPRAST